MIRPTVTGWSTTSKNVVLDDLRHIREAADRLEQDMSDLKTRVGRIETNVAQMHGALAEHPVRMDRIKTRLTRIEERLELADARGRCVWMGA